MAKAKSGSNTTAATAAKVEPEVKPEESTEVEAAEADGGEAGVEESGTTDEIVDAAQNAANKIIDEAQEKAKAIIADAQATASDITRKAKESAKTIGDQMVKDAENRSIEAMKAINQNGGRVNADPVRSEAFWMYNGGVETGILLQPGDEIPEGYTDTPS